MESALQENVRAIRAVFDRVEALVDPLTRRSPIHILSFCDTVCICVRKGGELLLITWSLAYSVVDSGRLLYFVRALDTPVPPHEKTPVHPQ
jgi:hypothetical protein